MTTPPFHPDQLGPGSHVGPWRILESLGAGGFGRAFKVDLEEQPGYPYLLKVALRPSSPPAPEEENVHGRLSREAAIHLAYETGVKVRSVDHWPTPEGYLYFVTDYIEGETFHEWSWRTQPSAARLVDVFAEVVRQVDALHRRGVCHRDLKSDNILIRKVDETPHLLDYGAARVPGVVTLTVGVPPTSPHLIPPECLAFLKEDTWKQGARFDPGVPGDLYALGLLLYEALTDSYAFDPKLPYNMLVVAIMATTPAAPHLLNPKAPRALSDIAMRLLEKSPEARYPNAEALLRALWEAAKERKLPEWQLSLAPPPPAAQPAPAKTPGPSEFPAPPADEAPAPADAEQVPETATAPPAPPVSTRSRGRWLSWGGLLVLFLALWVGLSTLAPTLEKGSLPVPTVPESHPHEAPRSSLTRFLAVALCSIAGMGCPAAQVKPGPAECPEEAQEAMFRVLGIDPTKSLFALLDIHQPRDQSQFGTYRDGPLVSRIIGTELGDPALPDGTLLYGQLWSGVVDERGKPAVMVRYSKAKLPDGRTYPVCIGLGYDGRLRVREGSKEGAAVLERQYGVAAVRRWP